jgi:hypothetical protein
MKNTARVLLIMACFGCPAMASAQILESVGSRALGMGGAFVGVATDSSATWWNPAALASGPFVDLSIGRVGTEVTDRLRARRDRTAWFALTTPPVGVSYYRFRVTEAAAPTAQPRADRQEGGTGVPIRSLSASQIGVTLVQSLVPGVHAGATLKYVRGTVHGAFGDANGSASDLLDAGQDIEGRGADGTFDLDIGVMAVGGPLRAGAVVRNVRQPEFDGSRAATASMRLPRQVRVGAAFDAEKTTAAMPLTVAMDVDLRRYAVATGDRRVIAVGAEQWLLERRLAVRLGGRFNTVGPQDRAATGGVSVAIRSGLYLDGHVIRGGSADDRGWGMAARVSF